MYYRASFIFLLELFFKLAYTRIQPTKLLCHRVGNMYLIQLAHRLAADTYNPRRNADCRGVVGNIAQHDSARSNLHIIADFDGPRTLAPAPTMTLLPSVG